MSRNSKSVFSNIGASNHSLIEREKNDFYSTDPIAITLLHKYGLLSGGGSYWENACGDGALSKELLRLGYDVTSSDKYDRGYGDTGIDFFDCTNQFNGSIITNPPYSFINDWIVHSLELARDKVYIFGRIQTIETIGRYNRIFKNNPPVYICPFVKRVKCYPNGDVTDKGSAVCYAWFIWDNKVDNEDTKVLWLI